MEEENLNRPIRKTAFMTFRKCQKKFEFMYNSPNYFDYNSDDPATQTDAMRKGSIFHKGCDLFFSQLEGRILTEHICETFRDALPRGTEIDSWFDWFAEEEAKRFNELVDLGKQGVWYPIAREIEIKLSDRRDRTGHVDRIDIIPETGDLCIVEYKTGKSYDMEKQYAVTEMNAEIGFYVQIMEKTNMFPTKKITHWKVINPTLGKIWMNNISPISLRAVDTTFNKIVDKIEGKGGEFEKTPSSACDYCPYINDCLFVDEPLISLEELENTDESKEI